MHESFFNPSRHRWFTEVFYFFPPSMEYAFSDFSNVFAHKIFEQILPCKILYRISFLTKDMHFTCLVILPHPPLLRAKTIFFDFFEFAKIYILTCKNENSKNEIFNMYLIKCQISACSQGYIALKKKEFLLIFWCFVPVWKIFFCIFWKFKFFSRVLNTEKNMFFWKKSVFFLCTTILIFFFFFKFSSRITV